MFIDICKRRLKCVLFHNGNLSSVIPIEHCVSLKEDYGDIKGVIELLKYNEHKWIIFVDLKMVCFLLGQQRAYTKYMSSMYGDSRAQKSHWIKK